MHAFGVLGRSQEDNIEMDLMRNDCEVGEGWFKKIQAAMKSYVNSLNNFQKMRFQHTKLYP